MSRTWQFADRRDAGQRLAAVLPALDPASTAVVAMPCGGVPVAEEICEASPNSPLAWSLTERIKRWLSIPTAPPNVLASLRVLVDDTICLKHPSPFGAVGNASQSFRQTSDQDVTDALQRCARFSCAQEGA